MPNGFYGPKEDWKKLEAPLLRIDDRLTAFAHANCLREIRNYHNWPERSLVWDMAQVRKLIQVFLESETSETFTFWICASADRGAQRLWKHKTLKKAVPLEEIENNLGALLQEAKEILDGWGEHELEPETVSPRPRS